MLSAVAPETGSAEDILGMAAPCCEIDADGTLGSGCPQQADAKVLCFVGHSVSCPDAENTNSDAWMCREHLDLGKSGLLVCSLCEGTVIVIREL